MTWGDVMEWEEHFENGFDMVALAGFDTYGQAAAEISKIEDNDLCPYDVWIYDVAQALHE